MSDTLGRDEFTATMGRLYQTTDDGFKGVHARLDVLNGRVGTGERERSDLMSRMNTVEKEVFPGYRRRRDDPPGDDDVRVSIPSALVRSAFTSKLLPWLLMIALGLLEMLHRMPSP